MLIIISKINGIIFIIYLLNKVYPFSLIKNKFPDTAFFSILTITFIFSFDKEEIILSSKIPEESILLSIGKIILPMNILAFKISILKLYIFFFSEEYFCLNNSSINLKMYFKVKGREFIFSFILNNKIFINDVIKS